MTIDGLLNSTKPILYETGFDEWPYALSGTCFPVRYGDALFIVSANHCYDNIGISPEQTLYPRPDDPSGFFGFDLKVRARSPQAKDDKYYDQVVLRVAGSHHTKEEIEKVVALDLAERSSSLLPTSSRIQDIWLRGYPFDCPEYLIDYDQHTIRQQAYVTNGCITTSKAPFDFCYYIKMITPILPGMSPKGMSGAPAYGVTSRGKPAYCGTVIEYNTIINEHLVIGPEVLVNSFRSL